MESEDKYCFAIDRGGTFTDVYCLCPNGKEFVYKLLSEDPANYEDAPREGIRRILEQETGVPYPADKPIDTAKIGWIRMGTTVATNALLERKGERMALVITEGFHDLLYIGNQARPTIFDLKVKMPEVLYDTVVEVKERLTLDRPDCQLEHDNWQPVEGITGEKLWVQQPVDEEKLREDLTLVREQGIKSLAVVLLHSYIYPGHELVVKKVALQLGFENISLSSDIMPMMRIVPRGYTAAADAYLTPHIQRYLMGFSSGFKDRLAGINVLFMQSDGGLTPMQSFSGSRAILSGPAGGVVGYAQTTMSYLGDSTPVIGFDMGGTSTDVSRYAGQWEHIFESTTAGITVQAPQLDINTVAAGGGSRLFFRAGLFVVGPESAGAHPGPVCYRKGGPLTVTDANLSLGRLLPEFFPKIFGPEENEPLDHAATLDAFDRLTKEVNEFLEAQKLPFMQREEVALGFIRVANEAMCRPIRELTQAKGYDTSRHVLACFGGAGGQHACSIARSLGMQRVYIHRYAGVLSAYGLALADVVHEEQEPANTTFSASHFAYLDERLTALEHKCVEQLKKQGFHDENLETEVFLHLRYRGTDCALMCQPEKHLEPSELTPKHGDFVKPFIDRYLTEFGFIIPERDIIVDDIRVRGVAKTSIKTSHRIQDAGNELPSPEKYTTVYFDRGAEKTPVFLLQRLKAGQKIPGPSLIIDKLSTILVDPNCVAEITIQGDVAIDIGKETKESQLGVELDAIQLSIFSHRFMSIAEQMGRVLQRTSISTNIKERLDFSCALFGPDGGLVSNAPHIPVHLGAMQEAVQFQLKRAKELSRFFQPGDVILSNHPCAGGSHLPDLTVITPVFDKYSTDPVFFVASRGHHADIGGITPGSMPPHSRTLAEEGAVFVDFLLVRNGEFQEKALTEALEAPGKAGIPGSVGTRTLQDNLSDLRAQVAANKKGISLVTELIQEYGLRVVQAYMGYIQSNAEVAVRQMLLEIAGKLPDSESGWKTLHAEDYMDDGTKIALTVSIDSKTGTAICDFDGTGPQVWGNTNAPRAITLSALIYCLRCMVGHDVPLNQGCLAPIEVRLPQGTILSPFPGAAVVGGNVLTSQRIVDVVFKAFGACAASQGCMNNITFGDEEMGYYETVAGGAGAGPGWNGRSGVHTHMTNTRITDPEVLERRYPIILKHFSLAKHTGGVGLYSGGDGVLRELLFRKPLMLSVLTERRVFAPYGLNGGENGTKGKNYLIRKDGILLNLGSKCAVPVQPGDTFRLQTPGGGGYGNIVTYKMCGTLPQIPEPETLIGRGSLFNYKAMQESV